MNRVQQIESQLGQLSPAELKEIRDWLDTVIEDQLEISTEFMESIKRGEDDFVQGRVRVEKPRIEE